MKIQILGGKVCLRWKSKTLLGVVNKLLKTKSLLILPSNFFALLHQVNFPVNNLNFHRRLRWWDWIQAIFLNLSTLRIIHVGTKSIWEVNSYQNFRWKSRWFHQPTTRSCGLFKFFANLIYIRLLWLLNAFLN